MTRLCATCHTNPAIADGRDCRDCLAAYLRRTRKVSPWVKLAQERRLTPKALA